MLRPDRQIERVYLHRAPVDMRRHTAVLLGDDGAEIFTLMNLSPPLLGHDIRCHVRVHQRAAQ